jgi:YD repeat-containing protein
MRPVPEPVWRRKPFTNTTPGLVKQSIDPRNLPTTFEYDRFGRQTSMTRPNGQIVETEYFDNELRIQERASRFGRSEMGRPIRIRTCSTGRGSSSNAIRLRAAMCMWKPNTTAMDA